MNTFSGLTTMNAGQQLPSTPQFDKMSRVYNNIWGAATDTHMFKDINGDRVIIGSFFANEDRLASFLYSRMIAGTLVDCKAGTGCDNLAQWLDKLGYTIDISKDTSHPLGVHARVYLKNQQ